RILLERASTLSTFHGSSPTRRFSKSAVNPLAVTATTGASAASSQDADSSVTRPEKTSTVAALGEAGDVTCASSTYIVPRSSQFHVGSTVSHVSVGGISSHASPAGESVICIPSQRVTSAATV